VVERAWSDHVYQHFCTMAWTLEGKAIRSCTRPSAATGIPISIADKAKATDDPSS